MYGTSSSRSHSQFHKCEKREKLPGQVCRVTFHKLRKRQDDTTHHQHEVLLPKPDIHSRAEQTICSGKRFHYFLKPAERALTKEVSIIRLIPGNPTKCLLQ